MTDSTPAATAVPHPPPVPTADRDDVVDTLHGQQIADPYRYLEDPDSDRTRSFVAAQNAVSEPYLATLPAARYFTETVTDLLTGAKLGIPWERGGRYFRTDNPGDADQDRLLVGDSLSQLVDDPRVLLDPNTLTDDGTAALVDCAASPDGTYMAIAIAQAGSDWRTITVLDVASGQSTSDELRWTKFLGPTWLPDSTGFLYWRYPQPTGGEFTESMPAGELMLHRLGTDQTADVQVWARDDDAADADWMPMPYLSDDGAWLILKAVAGTDSRSLIQARRVDPQAADGFGPTIDVVVEVADQHTPIDVVNDQLVLHTEAGTDRGRVVSVDLTAADPADQTAWRTLVAEHPEDLLYAAGRMSDALTLIWSRDTAHRIEVVDLQGRPIAELPVPPASSVAGMHGHADSQELFVGITSFTNRLTITRFDLAALVDGTVVATDLSAPGKQVAPMTAVRRSGTSADGTSVPMTIVRRADLPADAPAPTLLYGYGGFDIPVTPTFSAMFAAWVQAGGVFAVANLRGGGEFGPSWHEAGMKLNKQRVFDDLYGCAEELIRSGVTTTEQLAVHGRSNGGLLVGAALVQRPDLWAATLPTVGVLDMLRFHLFTIGRAWTSEYGSPDNADEFAALLAYSPLHNLTPGTAYPPTLICTGDHDDRVVPAHSLKFGAELQHCTTGPGPVLLRIDTKAGHGLGKPVRALAAEYGDQLAFAAAHTGLVPVS